MRRITYCPGCGYEQPLGTVRCTKCGTMTQDAYVNDDMPYGGTYDNAYDSAYDRAYVDGSYVYGYDSYSHDDMDMTFASYQSAPDSGMHNERVSERSGDTGLAVIMSTVAAVLVVAVAAGCIILTGGGSPKPAIGATTETTRQASETETTEAPSIEERYVETETTEATTEQGSTEAPKSGGGEAGYSISKLAELAEDYCRRVYGLEKPEAAAQKQSDGKVVIDISVTIDSSTGHYGDIVIDDRSNGTGTGVWEETVYLEEPEKSHIDKSHMGYIIDGSDTSVISDSDIIDLTKEELMLARNEIYARHGRCFNDSDISAYFMNKAWYAGIISADAFDDGVLSRIERTNIETIKKREKKLSDDSKKAEAASVEDESADDSGDYTEADENSVTESPSDDNTNSSDAEAYYIIEDSDTKKLTADMLDGFDKDELKLARCEIYARHGRRFNSYDIQAYFDEQSWYTGDIDPEDFDDSVLSDVEKYNIRLIKKYEKKKN